MENEKFLSEQIITYLGNKRKLLNVISDEVKIALNELGIEKGVMCDLFSGSGVVARKLKQYASKLYTNDLEEYSYIINDCYLTNTEDFNEDFYNKCLEQILDYPIINDGVIATNYAPQDDNSIKEGERAFYTHDNAVRIDTYREAIDNIVPNSYRKFFLAPLLYEASVHANTSGVFKGFYKSKTSNVGKFGGDGENALERILGKIELKKPVLSNYNCQVKLFKEDANVLVKHLRGLDITYIDPPYNQHPYGSNYFMLNTILKNKVGESISTVSGIPNDWNKSAYNKKKEALSAFEELVKDIDSKYLIISYNNEGFISQDEMENMLSKYGELKTKEIDYVAFRGSRNLQNRNIHTTEYIFVLKKHNRL
jgi:adenine-specific DNA-methyltransferase